MTRLTAPALARLDAERQQLQNVLLPEAQAAVAEAQTRGDPSQNPDYFLAAAEEDRLRSRHEQIVAAISAHHRAPSVPAGSTDAVHPGTVVTLDFGEGGEQFFFGSIEERVDGVEVVTPESPVGRAIAGAYAGATVALPSGATVTLVAVEPAA